jgi:hypothetical protein
VVAVASADVGGEVTTVPEAAATVGASEVEALPPGTVTDPAPGLGPGVDPAGCTPLVAPWCPVERDLALPQDVTPKASPATTTPVAILVHHDFWAITYQYSRIRREYLAVMLSRSEASCHQRAT